MVPAVFGGEFLLVIGLLGLQLEEDFGMTARRNEFSEHDKIKVLLWCGRHCCLCGKFSGVGIEVAHLDSRKSDIDNAIPLCFDCHAAIGHYSKEHPRGRKYSLEELKVRRNQVYEEHTCRLVPPVRAEMTQLALRGGERQFPDVGFSLIHCADLHPVKVRIRVEFIADGVSAFSNEPHYSGNKLWNLNPRMVLNGHFSLSEDLKSRTGNYELRIHTDILDAYDYQHSLLPTGYIYVPSGNYWYLEP
jgi:hypothetical protein